MEHSKQEKARGSIDSVDGYPQVFIAHISIDVLGTRATDDSSFLSDTGTTHHLVADRSLLKKLVDLEVPLRDLVSPIQTRRSKSWSNAKGVMERLKLMWGRKKFGIDMVMVNESREREREGSGKRRGVPEICGWFFDVARRGFDLFTNCKVYKSIQNGEPSALDHTSTLVLDTPLVLVVNPSH